MLKNEHAMGWAQWEADSIKMRSAAQMSKSSKPWTEPVFGRAKPLLKGVPPVARIHELLNVGYGSLPPPKDIIEFFAVVSQGVSRKSTFGNSLNFCMSDIVYAYQLDRIITGREMLAVMGYPIGEVSMPPGVSEEMITSFAGQGMHGPCVASVLGALVYNWHAAWTQP